MGVDTIPGALGDTAALLLRCASFAVAGLLWIGLATPVAGVSDAAIQVGVMLLEHHYDRSYLMTTALGLALAMLGPGAWSLDARMFGRKRIV